MSNFRQVANFLEKAQSSLFNIKTKSKNVHVGYVMKGILVTLKAFMNTNRNVTSKYKHYLNEHNAIIPACLFQQLPKLTNATPSVHIFSVVNTVFSSFSIQLSFNAIL